MKFVSTRGADADASLSQALTKGIASDGGLYVPSRFRRFPSTALPDRQTWRGVAETMLRPFAAGDTLAPALADICDEAFDFAAPLVPLKGSGGSASVLELFHGPTCAFKDFGARFLAAALERLRVAMRHAS